MRSGRWALTLMIDGAISSLREECARDGRLAVFEKLEPFLGGGHQAPYQRLAAELGATSGALKVAVHRLHCRCRNLVRAEIARTVAEPATWTMNCSTGEVRPKGGFGR